MPLAREPSPRVAGVRPYVGDPKAVGASELPPGQPRRDRHLQSQAAVVLHGSTREALHRSLE